MRISQACSNSGVLENRDCIKIPSMKEKYPGVRIFKPGRKRYSYEYDLKYDSKHVNFNNFKQKEMNALGSAESFKLTLMELTLMELRVKSSRQQVIIKLIYSIFSS